MKRENITIENGAVSIPQSGEIWMAAWEIAQMFDCFISKISSNVRSILKSGVFHETGVCRIYHYKNGDCVEQYNLVMITALAFRIKTRNAELFRNFIMKKAVTDTSRQDFLINLFWKRSGMLN